MSLVVDSHQHFWDPERGDYPWMSGRAAALRRPYTAEDLRPLLAKAGVDKTVVVQTWSSLEETREFLEIAATVDFVSGVVGWVDLTDPALADTLDELKESKHGHYLVGVRHQVHDEADADWLLRKDVQHGLNSVQKAGLIYDLLTRPRELPAALATVREHPELQFVIDHISKPEIAAGEIEQWRKLMQPFGAEKHVWCKVSGMVTEADWSSWTAADLKPYIEEVVSVFGTKRLLFGSDWPVSLLAAEYPRVKSALEENIASLDASAQADIMGRNAIAAYGLKEALS